MDDKEDWLGCNRCGQFFHFFFRSELCHGIAKSFLLLSLIIHLKYTQIATYLGVFFSFLKYVMELWLSLLKFTFKGKKLSESVFSKVSYII